MNIYFFLTSPTVGRDAVSNSDCRASSDRFTIHDKLKLSRNLSKETDEMHKNVRILDNPFRNRHLRHTQRYPDINPFHFVYYCRQYQK